MSRIIFHKQLCCVLKDVKCQTFLVNVTGSSILTCIDLLLHFAKRWSAEMMKKELVWGFH